MTERRNVIGDIWVGPRHPRANTAFEGAWMAADEETWDRLQEDESYTFTDASDGACGWCVVGDDPILLEQEAIDMFTEPTLKKTVTLIIREVSSPLPPVYPEPLIYTVETESVSDQDHLRSMIAQIRVEELDADDEMFEEIFEGIVIDLVFEGEPKVLADFRT